VSKADNVFFRQFGFVLGILVLFTIIVYFLASHLGDFEFRKIVSLPSATAERILPVGHVRIEGDKVAAKATASAAPAPAASTEPAASAGKTGEQAYASSCIACHATGVAGAPKVGDTANWSERAKTGIDALLGSVTNGKGAMPPKGGTALSAKELEAAIRFMLGKSGVEL